jgi:RHS repeat-associated protein
LTGVVAQRMKYDEFGVVLEDTNPGFQPFGYAGGFYDSDTGLVRFGARDYEAGVGRWLAKDDAGFSGGLNAYSYVSSNPINNLDFTGLAEICSRALNGVGFQLWIARHDQIWYEDGTNSGFFDTDDVRPDYIDPKDPSKGERSKDDYNSCTYLGPDDETKAAEKRLQKKMDMDWRTFDNNCQEYVDEVAKDPELVEARIKPVGAVTTGKK